MRSFFFGAAVFGLIAPQTSPPVATAYLPERKTESAPLTSTGDNTATLQAFFDSAPAGASVTLPAGNWPVRGELRIVGVKLVPPAKGTATLSFIGPDIPPPIDPPPPPIDPPVDPPPPIEPPTGTPNGQTVKLSWDSPSAGIRWTVVRYSEGGYTSPELQIAPGVRSAPGTVEFMCKAKRGSKFTVSIKNVNLSGASSSILTAVWDIPENGAIPAPIVTAGPATAIPGPTNPRLNFVQ